MTISEDPRNILANAPMRLLQIAVITLCAMLNALDGFDVLAISFASPGIATEWGIDRAALGLVLSMELVGMAAGSIILGNVADRIGRRPTIIGCIVVMASGMYLVTSASDVRTLSIFRLYTGLGIGGMLACTNAMVAELSNSRVRSLAVAVMAAGYPTGAIVGGAIASSLLATGSWRDIFELGAVMTAIFLPIAWLLLPESVDYLLRRRPANALARINTSLRRIGHSAVDTLPRLDSIIHEPSPGQLFTPRLRTTTTLLTIAYFAHIMTFYFILKWIPKFVVDMGHAPSAAGGVLVWANVGGLAGAVSLSMLSWRIGIKGLVIAAMLLSAAMVTLFGQVQADIRQLSLVAAVAGFCTNAGVVGLYAIIAQAYPTELRGSGSGFVIGVGRGGAALGPVVAGLLFELDFGLPLVAFVMACGSLVAAAAVMGLQSPRIEG